MKNSIPLILAVGFLMNIAYAAVPGYRTTFILSAQREGAYTAEIQVEKINPETASYEIVMSPTLTVMENQPASLTAPSSKGEELTLEILVSDEEKVTISVSETQSSLSE